MPGDHEYIDTFPNTITVVTHACESVTSATARNTQKYKKQWTDVATNSGPRPFGSGVAASNATAAAVRIAAGTRTR